MMVFIVYCYICGNVMDVKDTKKVILYLVVQNVV